MSHAHPTEPPADDPPPVSPPVPSPEPVAPSPPPEHLARLARLVEQGLPPALRGDRTGFD